MMALHSLNNCVITNASDSFTGHLKSSDCFTFSKNNEYFNEGCLIVAKEENTYGDGFNIGKTT